MKHTQNSQEQWRTTKDMANERLYITLLRMKSADSFRQICFPRSGFFRLFSCLLLCLALNWVQPSSFIPIPEAPWYFSFLPFSEEPPLLPSFIMQSKPSFAQTSESNLHLISLLSSSKEKVSSNKRLSSNYNTLK